MDQIQAKTQSQKGAINLPPRMKAALEQYQKRVWTIKLSEGVAGSEQPLIDMSRHLGINLTHGCLN